MSKFIFVSISALILQFVFSFKHITKKHLSHRSIDSIDQFYGTLEFAKERQFILNAIKKKPNSMSPMDMEKYLRLKELMKEKNNGASYEDMKELSINGTKSKSNDGNVSPKWKKNDTYQRYLGKGSLDQRLRAVIAYKRSTLLSNDNNPSILNDKNNDDNGNDLSEEEEMELNELMESDDDDEDYDNENDEEAEYEKLVLQAIENNKLNEVKRNLIPLNNFKDNNNDVNKTNNLINNDNNNSNDIITSSSNQNITNQNNQSDLDMYTPARSTWGLFQRPRDISQAYGGGRVISREEMDRLDEEWEKKEKKKSDNVKVLLSGTMKLEYENEAKIKDALSRSRGYMYNGNRQGAVKILESVEPFLSWQSDLGGEVFLEL
eukprot:gene13481-18086_t